MSRVNNPKQIILENTQASLRVLCDTITEDGVTLNKQGAGSLINLLVRVRNMLSDEITREEQSEEEQ